MQYRAKPVAVEAAQFIGQDLPGIERHYLGTDEVGQPIYQGIIRFDGGFATLHQGDWLIDGRIYTSEAFAATFEEVRPTPGFLRFLTRRP